MYLDNKCNFPFVSKPAVNILTVNMIKTPSKGTFNINDHNIHVQEKGVNFEFEEVVKEMLGSEGKVTRVILGSGQPFNYIFIKLNISMFTGFFYCSGANLDISKILKVFCIQFFIWFIMRDLLSDLKIIIKYELVKLKRPHSYYCSLFECESRIFLFYS